jgi:hypothetical protein
MRSNLNPTLGRRRPGQLLDLLNFGKETQKLDSFSWIRTLPESQDQLGQAHNAKIFRLPRTYTRVVSRRFRLQFRVFKVVDDAESNTSSFEKIRRRNPSGKNPHKVVG